MIMNDTNLLAALALAAVTYTNSVAFTNWVSFQGDFKRENGTNYVRQWADQIGTNTFRDEVIPVITYKTNRTAIGSSRSLFSSTNAPTQWTPSGLPPLPPTPGVPTKL